MDGLDAAAVGEAVAAARPDVIVNQMTALSEAHSGKPNLRSADRFFAITNRLRSEGVDHLLAAAEATGVSHVVDAGPRQHERDPHRRMGQDRGGPAGGDRGDEGDQPSGGDRSLDAGGAVLRYGGFYGPGANDDQVRMVRRTGCSRSWATAPATSPGCTSRTRRAPRSWGWSRRSTGVFNIVDDEPAPVSEWLPYLAKCAGAEPARRRVPRWLARLLAGDMAVGMMTEGRGFSNAKAKRELGWQLRYPSWRQGFAEELT